MKYSTFNKKPVNALLEPMFFGEPVGVSRYDQQKHVVFEKLIEKQISCFWRPEEIDVSRDRTDFAKLTDAEQHIFISNLKYQTLLDSIQGRSPNVAFLPIVSIPELETWIETWSFFETIHSRSYTHILRNIKNDPSAVFESIVENPHIQARALDVSKYYDELIEMTQWFNLLGEGTHIVNGKELLVNKRALKRLLYLAMVSVNVLEGIRFYVSFACTFAFAEHELMEGNAKIVRLVARDENIHLQSTQYALKMFERGKDDPEMAEIALECREEALAIFDNAVTQEKEWATYLFQDGSMIGLNKAILDQFVEYIANARLNALGWGAERYETTKTPLPWMNNYLNSDNVQVAPQETEISSYLVGQIDSDVSEADMAGFGAMEL
jgi:ribonucleoside-diphosphate reductase beta chain